MHDVFVVKAPDHMYYCLNFPYMSEEFVAQALAFRCALYKSGYIAEFDSRIDGPFGMIYI